MSLTDSKNRAKSCDYPDQRDVQKLRLRTLPNLALLTCLKLVSFSRTVHLRKHTGTNLGHPMQSSVPRMKADRNHFPPFVDMLSQVPQMPRVEYSK
jgi:hypothetical protein